MVSMRVVRALLDSVEQSQRSHARLMQAAQLEPNAVADLDRRVARAQVYRLCESALELTGDPALGLHWAERFPESAFSPISQLLNQSASLADALDLLAQFHWLLTDDLNFRVHEQADRVQVRVVPVTGASARVQRFVAEVVLTSLMRLLRAFRVDTRVERVSLEFAPPAYAAEYARVLGPRVQFQQACSGLTFERALLTATSPYGDAAFHNTLRSFTEQRIVQLTQQASYASRVRSALEQSGEIRRTSMQSVARELGVCERTLRRRLTEEGTSYEAVANAVYSAAAKAWLRDGRRSIKETAAALGFTDRRAFHRAFRRWTGTTPAQFRKSAPQE